MYVAIIPLAVNKAWDTIKRTAGIPKGHCTQCTGKGFLTHGCFTQQLLRLLTVSRRSATNKGKNQLSVKIHDAARKSHV